MQQEEITIQGIKVADYPDEELSVRGIFQHNHNWDLFRLFSGEDIRDVEITEVRKMLDCRTKNEGYIQYYCEHCDEYRTVHFGCNSRICSNCGKSQADRWATKLSKSMFEVPHRHVVLTIPERLWVVLCGNWDLVKVLMDSVIDALNKLLSRALRKEIRVGAIAVLHPYGRDISYKPHVHVLMTEGGFDRRGNFLHKDYIHYRNARHMWQYYLLTNLKKALPATKDNARMIDQLFKAYPEGFVAHLPPESRIGSKRMISKYIGRYVRHPAIANCRISEYDGERVTFWYVDNQDCRHYRTMQVFDFIKGLIQHIPERQFKMIRYYGAYSRRLKERYLKYLSLRSITQQKLDNIGVKPHSICPDCGKEMEFIMYFKPGPPRSGVFGGRIQDLVTVGDREPVRGIPLTK